MGLEAQRLFWGGWPRKIALSSKIIKFYNTFALSLCTLGWAIILDPVVLRLFWGGVILRRLGLSDDYDMIEA